VSQLVQLAPSAATQPAPWEGLLVDSFGRIHSDLRISVTDRCNIRCFYCMPEEGAQFAPIPTLLTFPQILQFVEAALPLGIRKIRLTGGEPLLRPKLPDLIALLHQLSGIEDLALTTNGVLLAAHARQLRDAGLRRLNVHLDTLDRGRFRAITRRDDLHRVLSGIDKALEAGLNVKLNSVAIKGLTEPDVLELVRFGRQKGIEVRFIEFMPLDAQQLWGMDRVLTTGDMIEMITREFGTLLPVRGADESAPATEFQFEDGFRLGFIASVSRPFCMNCNRLRLTSDGKMRYCLFAREETDVRTLLNSPNSREALQAAIRLTVWRKWIGHDIHRGTFVPPSRPMYSIGG
jgi:GTP 3',8-cyclase